MPWKGIIVLVAGLFCLASAVFNWDWFFEHYKSRWVVALLGRGGARFFYGAIGLILVGMSVAVIVAGGG